MAVIVRSSGFLQFPAGTTAQVPGSPALGMVRIDTTRNAITVYNGYAWVIWKAF
jgi:hypothetical protein